MSYLKWEETYNMILSQIGIIWSIIIILCAIAISIFEMIENVSWSENVLTIFMI